MNLAEDIKPISYVKARAAEVIDKISKTKHSLIITQNGETKAVLTDVETYNNMRNTLAMLKLLALTREDVKDGRMIEHADAKLRLQKPLQDRFKKEK